MDQPVKHLSEVNRSGRRHFRHTQEQQKVCPRAIKSLNQHNNSDGGRSPSYPRVEW